MATGVYQLVGNAGANQVRQPKIAMVQNIGGTGVTVVTRILAA